MLLILICLSIEFDYHSESRAHQNINGIVGLGMLTLCVQMLQF